MEPRIIHDHDLSWVKRRDKALANVFCEDVGVAVAFKAEGSLQRASAQCGNDAGAPRTIAGFLAIQALATPLPSACKPVAMVDAAFVQIYECFWVTAPLRGLPQRTRRFVTLGVEQELAT